MILENINDSILNDTKYSRYDNTAKIPENEITAENEFLSYQTDMGLRVGLADPTQKVYHRPKPIEPTPFILFAAIYGYLPSVGYHQILDCLFRKGKNDNDPIRFAYGMSVVLYQYGEKPTKKFFHYMAQYVKSCVCKYDGNKEESSKTDKNRQEKLFDMFNYTKMYEELAMLCEVDAEVFYY